MKHDLVTLVVIMILKHTATSQVQVIVSLFCAWNITTVEINSGVHLEVKSAKCLCLLSVVLVLVLRTCCLVYIIGTNEERTSVNDRRCVID